MADFGGFPSSIIEGTYRENDMTLNTSRRNVIATSGRDKYLVSFAVTTDAALAVADGPATDAIINGFRVTAPGAPAPAPVRPGACPGRTARAGARHGPGSGASAGPAPVGVRAPDGSRQAPSPAAAHAEPAGAGARAAAAAQPAPESLGSTH